jgi:hypothetical protein
MFQHAEPNQARQSQAKDDCPRVNGQLAAHWLGLVTLFGDWYLVFVRFVVRRCGINSVGYRAHESRSLDLKCIAFLFFNDRKNKNPLTGLVSGCGKAENRLELEVATQKYLSPERGRMRRNNNTSSSSSGAETS